jgi:hypothetical protein
MDVEVVVLLIVLERLVDDVPNFRRPRVCAQKGCPLFPELRRIVDRLLNDVIPFRRRQFASLGPGGPYLKLLDPRAFVDGESYHPLPSRAKGLALFGRRQWKRVLVRHGLVRVVSTPRLRDEGTPIALRLSDFRRCSLWRGRRRWIPRRHDQRLESLSDRRSTRRLVMGDHT